jgi:hypothetical protein
MTVSPEKIAEMLAAAEKATPGPWEARTQAEWTTGYDFFAGKDGAFCFPVDLEAEDAAHINNCDPQTITDLLTELQHRREAEAVTTVTTRAGACMWAEVVDGSPFQWECYEADGRGEASNHVTIELMAATFALGTKLAIYEPGFFPEPPALAASPSSPATGVRVIGYMRKEDVAGPEPAKSSFWVSYQENAYYAVPVLLSALGEHP